MTATVTYQPLYRVLEAWVAHLRAQFDEVERLLLELERRTRAAGCSLSGTTVRIRARMT